MFNNEEVMHALEKGEITIDQALKQLTDERATDGNGLAIGTVIAIRRPDTKNKGKYITEIRTAGFRDWSNTEPVETSDIFRIYSVTKTFTATIIKQLHEKGKLCLDDKLTDWIQRISRKNIEDGHPEWNMAFEKLNIHPNATIEDLLSHRSGIGSYPQGAFIAAANSAPGKYWSLYDLFAYNVVEKSGADKNDVYGTFCYSDTGYNLLALIIGHAAEKPYETMVQELCSEKGLYYTCFTTQAKEMESKGIARLAHGYIQNPAKSGEPTSSMEYDTGKGTGGILSTAEEMLIWAEHFYDRNKSEVTEHQTTPIIGKTPSRCGDARYGHGIMIQNNGDGRNLYGHGGYARGGRSKVYYYPDSCTSIVTLESFETITPNIAKELIKEYPAFADVNKTTLLLRDIYTDNSGAFNRAQLWDEWQKSKNIVVDRVFERALKVPGLATFMLSPQTGGLGSPNNNIIITPPVGLETTDKVEKSWAEKIILHTSQYDRTI